MLQNNWRFEQGFIQIHFHPQRSSSKRFALNWLPHTHPHRDTHTHALMSASLSTAFCSGRHTQPLLTKLFVASLPLRHSLSCKGLLMPHNPPSGFPKALFHGDISTVTFSSHDLWVCRVTLDKWEQTGCVRSWSWLRPSDSYTAAERWVTVYMCRGEEEGGCIAHFLSLCVSESIHACLYVHWLHIQSCKALLPCKLKCLFVCISVFC